MKHATSSKGPAAHAATWLLRLGHVSLISLGLVALVYVADSRLEATPSTSFDALVTSAAASETAPDNVAVVESVQPEPVIEPGLSGEMSRVRDWVARRYRVSTAALEPVLLAAEEAGRHAGIDPLLIVAVMAVESSFNPFAESHRGAQGLMQVIPRFHMDKIDKAGGGRDALFDPEVNVRVGTLVLHEGLRRYGSMQSALQYYGGALSDPEASYARKVMAMKQRLLSAAGRKAGNAA